MSLVRLELDPAPREVRRFGLVWLPVACALLAGFGYSRGCGSVAAGLLGVAAASVSLALVRPGALKGLLVAAALVTFPLNWLVVHLLFAVVYFGLITPLGWILRLTRGDPLARHFDRESQSYWIERPSGSDRSRYFRQY